MDPAWADVFPIKNGDIPASYVSFLEGKWILFQLFASVNGLACWFFRPGGVDSERNPRKWWKKLKPLGAPLGSQTTKRPKPTSNH